MRIVIIVLVLLNLLAFASMQGWLGTSTERGEPERLSNQLNPERIVLRRQGMLGQERAAEAPPPKGDDLAPPAIVDAPPPEPEVCVALSGLGEARTEDLLQTLVAEAPGVAAEHLTSSTASSWWVRIPPSGGREGAERRASELRALGIEDLFIVQDAGPNQFAVSLGLFKTEAKAQQHLAFLQRKRVRSASIAARTATVHRIELRGSAARIEDLTRSNTVRQSGATTGTCTS